MIKRICIICKKEFKIRGNNIKRRLKKTCSSKCSKIYILKCKKEYLKQYNKRRLNNHKPIQKLEQPVCSHGSGSL